MWERFANFVLLLIEELGGRGEQIALILSLITVVRMQDAPKSDIAADGYGLVACYVENKKACLAVWSIHSEVDLVA